MEQSNEPHTEKPLIFSTYPYGQCREPGKTRSMDDLLSYLRSSLLSRVDGRAKSTPPTLGRECERVIIPCIHHDLRVNQIGLRERDRSELVVA
jgi:hypothetical protein